MKKIILLITILVSSCSKIDYIDCVDDYDSEYSLSINSDSLLNKNNTDTLTQRSIPTNSVYVISKLSNEYIKYDIVNNKIKLCFSVINNNLYLRCNNKRILANGNFILSTINIFQPCLDNSNVKTPNGKDSFKSFGDKLFISDNISFFRRNKDIHIRYNGSNHKLGSNLTIKLNRMTFNVKVRIIITDMYSGLIFHNLNEEEFTDKYKLGNVNTWKCGFFILNAVNTINASSVYKKYEKGNKIINISDYKILESNQTHDIFQIKWGKPVIIGRFTGIGSYSLEDCYIFPFETLDSYLCYSFVNDGRFNTLQIPLSGIKGKYEKIIFEPNDTWEITTIIDIFDFSNAMKNNKRGIIDIPYKIYLKK